MAISSYEAIDGSHHQGRHQLVDDNAAVAAIDNSTQNLDFPVFCETHRSKYIKQYIISSEYTQIEADSCQPAG